MNTLNDTADKIIGLAKAWDDGVQETALANRKYLADRLGRGNQSFFSYLPGSMESMATATVTERFLSDVSRMAIDPDPDYSFEERKVDILDLVKHHRQVDFNGLFSSCAITREVSRLRLLAWEKALELLA